MTVTIQFISRNAGDGSHEEKIERLCEVLESHTLNPRFEEYGDFCYEVRREPFPAPMNYRFFGNFVDYSFAFGIYVTGDDPLFDRLLGLIRSNKASHGYQVAKASLRGA